MVINKNLLRFFYMESIEEYNQTYKNLEEDINRDYYFYIVKTFIENVSGYILYLGNIQIASSDSIKHLEAHINALIQTAIEKSGHIKNDKSSIATIGELTIDKKFSAPDLTYENNKYNIKSIIGTDLTVETINSSNINNDSNIATKTLQVTDSLELNTAQIIFPELIEYKDSNDKIIWSLNTTTGKLTVQEIDVISQATINNVKGSLLAQETNLTVNQIKLGNIILQENNGNLEIISADVQ